MKRQFCKIKHDPENGTYGDCLRACIATLLGYDVPHFFEDGCDGETGHQRLRDFLTTKEIVPIIFSFPGSVSKEDLFEFMREQNSGVKYILFCKCGGEDHAVICQNDSVVFNPAWAPHPVTGPNSNGLWVIMALGVN